jgi:hypothetical protein
VGVFLLGTVVGVITLVLIALVVAALYVSSPTLQAVVVGGLIGVVGSTSRRRHTLVLCSVTYATVAASTQDKDIGTRVPRVKGWWAYLP